MNPKHSGASSGAGFLFGKTSGRSNSLILPSNQKTWSFATNFAANMDVTSEMFELEARDKIAAMILSKCDDRFSFLKVISSFPSAELLNNLMYYFLASHIA
jgi:hypothetical protein